MRSNSQIETVLNQIVTVTLPLIVDGNDYHNDIIEINRVDKPITDSDEFPILNVVKGDFEGEVFTDVTSGGTPYLYGKIPVHIVGFIEEREDNDVEVNKLFRDVTKAMTRDLALGGTAIKVEFQSCDFQQHKDPENIRSEFNAVFLVEIEDII